MKHFKLLFTLSIALLYSLSGNSQTADEIISKYITAIGGSSNWEKINSIFYEGDFEVHGMKVKLYKTVLHGKGMRLNMSAPEVNAYEIITPAEGWEFKPFLGQTKPEQINAERLNVEADQYDVRGVFIDYKLKGHTMEYVGKEIISGKECFKIVVTHKSGKIENAYFDATSYFLVRNILKQKGKGDVVTEFSNYKLLPEGVCFPMTISTNPGTGETTIKKVEINKQVNESIFKPVS